MALAIFVQCNILPACGAVELRKVQANHSSAASGRKEQAMIKNFDEMQKVGKDNVDATLKSFGALSKATQTIAAEVVDYSKKSFEDGTKLVEKLFGAKSLDKAIEIQT